MSADIDSIAERRGAFARLEGVSPAGSADLPRRIGRRGRRSAHSRLRTTSLRARRRHSRGKGHGLFGYPSWPSPRADFRVIYQPTLVSDLGGRGEHAPTLVSRTTRFRRWRPSRRRGVSERIPPGSKISRVRPAGVFNRPSRVPSLPNAPGCRDLGGHRVHSRQRLALGTGLAQARIGKKLRLRWVFFCSISHDEAESPFRLLGATPCRRTRSTKKPCFMPPGGSKTKGRGICSSPRPRATTRRLPPACMPCSKCTSGSRTRKRSPRRPSKRLRRANHLGRRPHRNRGCNHRGPVQAAPADRRRGHGRRLDGQSDRTRQASRRGQADSRRTGSFTVDPV